MKKICKDCNDDFVGHHRREYCSSQCQEKALKKYLKKYHSEVFFPEIDKKYKYQLKNIKGQKWSSKCYNLTA